MGKEQIREYVDTRGVWPTYVKGVFAVSLEGKPLSISLEDARYVAEALSKQ
jgi:hypothetical protein